MAQKKLSIAFATLGCKLNFAETSMIKAKNTDFEIVPFSLFSDIYVINSCTVTDIADKKGRNLISRARRQNPDAKIVVMGCQSQVSSEVISKIDGVSLVLGNKEKGRLYEYISSLKTNEEVQVYVENRNQLSEFQHAYSWGDRTRSFIKVQDGCNYFCNYCIIPYARGESRSAPISEIITEINELEQRGVNEIVLTGINIGDYGRNSESNLHQLLLKIQSNTKIPRIRISSLEPDLLTDPIIELIASDKRFLPHLHLPLQAGTNTMLKSMNRRYSVEFYASLINKTQQVIPDLCVGTDIIVGFPGETNDEFNEAYQYLSQLQLSYFHVFSYSLRKGTPAASMENQVLKIDKDLRSKKLHDLSSECKHTFYSSQLQKTKQVLFERIDKEGIAHGFTENYIPVEVLATQQIKKNTICNVKLIQINTENVTVKSDLYE